MINQGNNVPDKTIAVFPRADLAIDDTQMMGLIKQPGPKRDWFNQHFYRCLPLVIGNQYGFYIVSEFTFSAVWDGGDSVDSVSLEFFDPPEVLDTLYPNISTHFGFGIVTVNPPFFLRTPPGINLMTINPPNYVLPNITVMTGVVETDNLRRNFTFNLKLQIPNIKVVIPAGTPLAAFIPIERGTADDYSLVLATELFDQDVIEEEIEADRAAKIKRTNVETNLKHMVGRDYYLGKDVYGNVFPQHQAPKKSRGQ